MTMLLALIYLFVKRHFVLRIPLNQIASAAVLVLKVAAAPFGLAMSPNIYRQYIRDKLCSIKLSDALFILIKRHKNFYNVIVS